MQAFVLVLLALLALTNAQDTSSGCCFYSQPQYQGTPVLCGNDNTGFDKEVKIQSYFCNRDYSAAIFEKANLVGDPLELVECGEGAPTLAKEMSVNSIAIGRCAQVACCFYSGETSEAGGEYCISVGAPAPAKDELDAVQKDGKFKLLRCLPGRTARLTHSNGATDVPCGGETKSAGDLQYTSIAISDCAGGPAKAVEDDIVEGFLDPDFADQETGEFAVGDETTDFATADQTVGEFAVGDETTDFATADQTVGDSAVGAETTDFAVAEIADQAVGDIDDSLTAEIDAELAEIDQAAGEDLALSDLAVEDFATGDQIDLAMIDQVDLATIEFVDQAVGDFAVGDDQSIDDEFIVDQIDLAVADQAVSDDSGDLAVGDQAVADENLGDLAVADETAGNFATIDDEAVDEQLLGDDEVAIDQLLLDDQNLGDQAVTEENFGDLAVTDNFDSASDVVDPISGDPVSLDESAVGDFASADQAAGDFTDQSVSFESDGITVDEANADNSQSLTVSSNAFSVSSSFLVVLVSLVTLLA